MGIAGLLPFLKKASSSCHVRRFSGCTVAIDAYCWLHKGAFGCADKLGKGEPTTAYVTYCLKYINILLSHNIKPILVLDGRNLPSKASTEKKRREKREENRKNAKEFLKKGMKKEAWECFTRCVDITPAMAREFIKTLREMKIDYVIAPYEADAQLAYMARKNIVDIVITEDSDLVLFGCPKIFFKMNINGDGVLFDQAKLPVCMGVTPEQFHFERFRWMCILSGCDYLASLPGIGLGRAKKLIDGSTSRDIRKILKSIPRTLRLDVEVPEDYIQGFIQAENTFLYQLVFDTISRRMVPLTPYAADVIPGELVYAGSYTSDKKLALDMALGNVDIHTFKQVGNFDPAAVKSGYNHQSIWSPHYSISSTPRLVTARDLKNSTKHTPTIGMQVNISCNSVIKKRTESANNSINQDETTDDDLISMYGFHEESSAASTSVGTPEKENGRKSSKRHRKMSDSENSASENEEDVNKSPARKRINPFLKFSKSNTKSPNKGSFKVVTDSTLNAKEDISLSENVDLGLVCLIQKNKIYDDDDDHKNIIVKSQYFRNTDTKTNCTLKGSLSGEREIVKCKSKITGQANFDIFIQNDGDNDTDKSSPKLAEGSEGDKLSQLSIYSILEDDLEKMDESDSQKLSDDTDLASQGSPPEFQPPLSPENLFTISPQPNVPVITLDDCDLNSESKIGEIKLTVRSPVAATSRNSKATFSKQISSQGARRKLGLFKSTTKIDPKQKTLSSMFALQQKPKL